MGYHGRLELTWTNKDKALLAQESGSYEWVPPSDYRVAEVRLLWDERTVGEVHPERQRAKDNLVIKGDALYALSSLIGLPEFAREYVGKVKLAYLDPPFNTQQAFAQYDDSLEHSVWLTMMRDRLRQIKMLLSPSGSVWVHCDDSEQHRLRCVMDEVFGPNSFVATIIWEARYSRSNDAAISVSHHYLLVYALDPKAWAQERNPLPRGRAQTKQYRNPDNDPRGPWRAVPWDAPNVRPNLSYPIVSPSGKVHFPPPGRHWLRTEDQWHEIVRQGLAYFGKDGKGKPAYKQFLKDLPGIVPNTWWSHEECGHSDEAKKEIMALFPNTPPFDTPKPERLLWRIIHIATSPGDIVLDCFAGSGTTPAVAHKMGRRWVAIEWSAHNVSTYLLPRLERVVQGKDPGGITEEVGWKGGGGFRVLTVAPSMFDVVGGRVVLADWATNSALAEATAAQLGFEYQADPPFCGRKGRKRLAVIDGLVNEDVVRLVAQALPVGEVVTICGTALDPAARELLKRLRPGSTLRKIPLVLLAQYRYNQVERYAEQEAAATIEGSEG